MEDFGIIVTCNQTDFLFAKGCCASIRYFMGDVPICLLVDGNFSTDSIAKTYNTKVIKNKDIQNQTLALRSFGWGLTKMIAFWESPFEYFLLLDADTCVWGNVLKYADFVNYDVIVDVPCYGYSDELITEYFFDVNEIKALFQNFDYKSHPYVCTGVIFGKRNIFDINEYISIMDLKDKHPHLFKYGEMGFLNFMLFRAKQEARLRVGAVDTQYIVIDFDFTKTKETFIIDKEPVVKAAPTVIHWAGGGKPVLNNSNKYYIEPMTFFRKKFLADSANISGEKAEAILKREDWIRNVRQQSKYYKRKIMQKFLR